MSRSLHTWYSLPDLDAFAERGTVLEGALELSRLRRLRDLLSSDIGRVRARLRFQRHRAGEVSFELSCEANLELVCQRCLEPMRHAVAIQAQMSVVEAETEPSMQEYEPVFLEGDRFNPAELVEDELIVSLPLAPRHADRGQCGRLARRIDELNSEASEAPPNGAAPTNH
jgi:uncharacterized protein